MKSIAPGTITRERFFLPGNKPGERGACKEVWPPAGGLACRCMSVALMGGGGARQVICVMALRALGNGP